MTTQSQTNKTYKCMLCGQLHTFVANYDDKPFGISAFKPRELCEKCYEQHVLNEVFTCVGCGDLTSIILESYGIYVDDAFQKLFH